LVKKIWHPSQKPGSVYTFGEVSLRRLNNTWQKANQQARQGVMNNTPVPGKINKFGARYTVDIPVSGPKGSAIVRTGWIYRPGSQVPELTTLL